MPPSIHHSTSSTRLVVIISTLVASILGTLWVIGLGSYLPYFRTAWQPFIMADTSTTSDSSILADSALQKVLDDASPIFGPYSNVTSDTSSWMSHYPDDTRLVHMNIPGVHDAATWNYSAATQRSLKHATDLLSDATFDPDWFRCQDRSIIHMLNAGIRAFDLRYAQDVTKSTLVFWHGPALQSQTATLEDVLFAFYKWLDDRPSETVFLSFQYEPNESMKNVDSEYVQMQLYNVLTSPTARRYISQTRNAFGTLGAARGKIVLLRRFDLNLLPQHFEETIPGVHFSPSKWTANSPDIALRFRDQSKTLPGEESTAYIEDYYQPLTLPTSKLEENIDIKFNATRWHLEKAALNAHHDALFWTFTSGTNVRNKPDAVTPRKMALGDEEQEIEGINHKLLKNLKDMKGKRLGIVMFDFFEEPEGLLPAFLSLKAP